MTKHLPLNCLWCTGLSTPQRAVILARAQAEVLPGSRFVCGMPASGRRRGSRLGAPQGSFFSVTATAEELSIVCLSAQVPAEIHHETDWACLKLDGPFPFSETGILASFVRPLSERAIPIFAVSTFDTDYVLVKHDWVEKAVRHCGRRGTSGVKRSGLRRGMPRP